VVRIRGAEEGDDGCAEGVGEVDGSGIDGAEEAGAFEHGRGAEEGELAREDRGRELRGES